MYVSKSIRAGAKFLSVGLIIKFLFCWSEHSALICIGLRLEECILLFFSICFCCLALIDFSNRVIFSSVRFSAGGGFLVVFLLYSCLTYSESVVVLLEFKKYFVLIEYAIFKMVLLMLLGIF